MIPERNPFTHARTIHPHYDRSNGRRVSIGEANLQRDVEVARSILASHGLEAVIQPKAPEFRPGDVVVLRFAGNPTPYTYVRGRRDWPGDGCRKTDAEMADAWRQGKARLVVRDGQHYSDLGPSTRAGVL